MNLLKAIIVSPGDLFRNSIDKRKEIVSLFVVSFVVVLLKSLFERKHAPTNFFNSQTLNDIFSFLAIPQVVAIITYLLFFVFVIVLFFIIKLFSKEVSFQPLLLSLMSISCIGVIAHFITIPLIFFAKSMIMPISYMFYLWVIALSFWSIKNSQDLPLVKVIPVFIVVVAPFLLFGWLLVISPYLMFLSV